MAALAGHAGAAAGAAAVLAMTAWLLLYRNVSAPVNRQLTAAAHDGMPVVLTKDPTDMGLTCG